MKLRKYLAAVIAFSLLLAVPALMDAQELGQGDDFDTATEIQVPGEWSGTLDEDNDVDFYTFELEPSQIIGIEFSTNAPSEQRLRFYNPTRGEVFRLDSSNNAIEDDDYGLAYDSGPDHWYVSIEKRYTGSDGDYTFTVTIDHQNDAGSGGDVPDNFDEAYEIEEGEHTGMLKDLDEKDMYKIELGPSSIVEIEFRSEAPSEQRLRFYNPTRDEVFRLDSSQNVAYEDDYGLAYETPTDHWYISIEKRYTGSDGDYTFTVTIGSQDDAGSGGDVPDNFDEAYEIEEGEHTGMLKDLDEKDMYKIELGPSSIVEIEFRSEAPSHQTLTFYNPNREELLGRYSSGGSSYSFDYLLAYETEPDHWYIGIEKRYGDSDGDYTFTVSIDYQNDAGSGGDAPSTFDEAYEIDEGDYEGRLGDLDRADMYKIYVESGSLIELEFSSESPSAYYDEHHLILFNPDRSQELSLQSSGGTISRDEHPVSSEMDSDHWYLKVETVWASMGIHSRAEYTFSVAIEELEEDDEEEDDEEDDDEENDDEENDNDDEYIPYSDVVTDNTGDVMRFVTEDDWTLVENPQLDIVKVEVSEDEDWVYVELTVLGTITDSPSIDYEIFLKCSGGGTYEIYYNNGDCEVIAERFYDGGGHVNHFEPPTHGAGTSMLTIVFTREQIGEPEDLLISEVYARDESKLEIDMAGPDADYPPGYGEERFEPVDPVFNVIYDVDDFPMDVTVQIGLRNDGDLAGDVSLYIDGTLVYTLSVPANGENTYEHTHTFDEPGSYDIEFYDQSHTVFVSDPDDDNGETPPDDDNGEVPPDDDNGEVDDDDDDDDDGMLLWIIPIIAVVVIALVLVVILMKRKGDGKESPQEQPLQEQPPQEQPPQEQPPQQQPPQQQPPQQQPPQQQPQQQQPPTQEE